MRGAPFIKMHGCGNDFVVLDARAQPLALDADRARAIADRHRGVGCDQVIVIETPRRAEAAALMRIRNADGGEVEACGNAARCVAALIMRETGANTVAIETGAGLIAAEAAADGGVTVDLGPAILDWRRIPLAHEVDTLNAPVAMGPLSDPVCTGMGNPHATFFVADAEAVDLSTLGPALEHHPLFPARANIGVAQMLSRERIRLRVWERGAGLTPACGTGACAALVAAHRRGLAGRSAAIVADGGTLFVRWREDGHVLLSGAVAVSFTGTLDPSLLKRR
jgi:diaminopimelate epimerase